MSNLTTDLIERVRAAIGTKYVRASDSDIARALGLSRTAIGQYLSGQRSIGMDALPKVAEVLQLSDAETLDLTLQLSAHLSRSDDARAFWERLRVSKPIAEGLRNMARKVSGFLPAAILAGMVAHSPTADAGTYTRSGIKSARSVYTLCEVRRRLRRALLRARVAFSATRHGAPPLEALPCRA